MSEPVTIRAVMFDWAGTTVDHGCFAPVAPFMEAVAELGVSISSAEARKPMGLHKRDHLVAILSEPEIAARFRAVHQREWNQRDIDRMFERFITAQLTSIRSHAKLIPGVLDTVAELRRRGIGIGGTTGYFREAAKIVIELAAQQGYSPDLSLTPEDVAGGGRPWPWMIYRIMEHLRVCPPAAVLKIGDTIPDMEEGRNAGVWTFGVRRTGSEIGLTAEELDALPVDQRQAKLQHAESVLMGAGAHGVIDSVADVPALIDALNARLARGERP